MGLVAWAEQTIPSGIAALLVALMPMWLAIFGLVILGERLPRAGIVGIAVGLVGVAILAWPTAGVDDLDPAGLLALLISPDLLVARLDLCRATGRAARTRAVRDRPRDGRGRPRAPRRGHRSSGELATFDVGAVSTAELGRACCTCSSSAASSGTRPSPGC